MLLTGLVYLPLAACVPGACGGHDPTGGRSTCSSTNPTPRPRSDGIVKQARAAANDEDAPKGEGAPDCPRLALWLLLIGLFARRMRPVGFVLAVAIDLFAQFALSSPSGLPVPWLGLAAVVATAIFLLFRYGFSLMLSAGSLAPFPI